MTVEQMLWIVACGGMSTLKLLLLVQLGKSVLWKLLYVHLGHKLPLESGMKLFLHRQWDQSGNQFKKGWYIQVNAPDPASGYADRITVLLTLFSLILLALSVFLQGL